MVPRAFIISPPFGNYFGLKYCTRVMGTYTWERRPGYWSQLIKTLRRTKYGWTYKTFLRNPGIRSVKKFYPDRIYSISMLTESDWLKLYNYLPNNLWLEINANHLLYKADRDEYIELVKIYLPRYINKFEGIIIKLPAYLGFRAKLTKLVLELGITHVHVGSPLYIND